VEAIIFFPDLIFDDLHITAIGNQTLDLRRPVLLILSRKFAHFLFISNFSEYNSILFFPFYHHRLFVVKINTVKFQKQKNHPVRFVWFSFL
jgi:hypothetical protein